MSYHKKTDGNQQEIMTEFRRLGATVQTLHTVGRGVPDLLVGYKGLNLLVEVKSERGVFTPEQVKWFEKWQGTVYTIWTISDCEMCLEIAQQEYLRK
jgi:hypothetical protein